MSHFEGTYDQLPNERREAAIVAAFIGGYLHPCLKHWVKHDPKMVLLQSVLNSHHWVQVDILTADEMIQALKYEEEADE